MKSTSGRNYFIHLLLAMMLVLAITDTHAQHYDFIPSAGTFTPINSGTGVDAIEVDDALSAAISIGFSFNYFGTSYTQFKASSNGFITFDPVNDPAYFNNITSPGLFIAPFWDDLDGSSGSASYILTGAPGSRILTFEWLGWGWAVGPNSNISFQLKLYEAGNKIEFIYRQDGGPINDPFSATASIGFSGTIEGQFYSLSDASSISSLTPGGNNAIGQKPVTDQTFTFSPGTPPLAPVSPASNITTPTLGARDVTLAWTNGNGNYRAVFMKQTLSTSETPAVSDGIFYFASPQFGNSSSLGGWYCVYNGLGNSVNITNLAVGTNYRIHVVEYNGLAGFQKYKTTTATNNPLNIQTLLVAPSAPITQVQMFNLSDTHVNLGLLPGDGDNRVVFMRAGNTGTAPVVNNTTYNPNTVFGAGSQISTSGWYCVFKGPAITNLTVTGLSGNTAYSVHVVDYNGGSGFEKYNISSDVNNPLNFATFSSTPPVSYSFSASSTTFTPINGGTAVDDIEDDDTFSPAIPVGFTFNLDGIPFTQLVASSNGFLTFNPYAQNAILHTNQSNNIKNSTIRPVIAPLWDDMDGWGGQASYATTGIAPNRIFTFEYLNWLWDWSSQASNISFQVKLYETSNKIEFIYRGEAGALGSYNSASIGLGFHNTGAGNFVSLNNSSAAPVISTSVETTTISAKPATGQRYTFTPVKLDQTITFDAIANRFFDAGNFILNALSNSGLPISYSSSNTAVATVNGSSVTIVGIGSVTITASQPGDDTYNAATSIPQTFAISRSDQTIIFTQPAEKIYGDAPFNLGATSSSGLTATYSSSNPGVATVSGDVVTIVGAGMTDITASQEGNANYNSATSITQPFHVNKANQIITFTQLVPKKYGDASFDLDATSSSGLTVTYSSSNHDVATVSGDVVTIVGAGMTNITASQAGNTNYNPASFLIQAFTVSKRDQIITFNSLETKTIGDADIVLNASASSRLIISYSSSNLNVATISGHTVTIVGIGMADIIASQVGDNNYNAAILVTQALIVKANQTITFNPFGVKRYGDPNFSPDAISTSGLPVVYTSSNGSVATITGSMIAITGSGTTTITAIQDGNATYNAVSFSRILIVDKGAQTVTFNSIADHTLGDSPLNLNASSNSSLPITFSSTSDKVSIAGNNLTILKAGSVMITAQQSGNLNYEAATSVNKSFCINPQKPIITITGLEEGAPVLTSNSTTGNQWFKDNVAINGATNSIHNVASAGIYTVVVSADNCHSVPSSGQTFVITDIETNVDEVQIFPNPAENEIIVDVTGMQSLTPVSVEIYNINGSAMLSTSGNGRINIKVSSLSTGNYMLKIQSGKKLITKHITKK